MASLYFINNIGDSENLTARMRRKALVNGLLFAVLFVAFVVMLMLNTGLRYVDGTFVSEPYLYFHNLTSMWVLAVIFLFGVVAVLYGILRSAFDSRWRAGIWYAGFGTFAVVVVLFLIAGYADTAYLPSTLDPASSLTIANSSSSFFTLKAMSWVSILVPFVLAYIAYVWHSMDKKKLTPEELENTSHKY